MTTETIVQGAYLLASALFVLALMWMSSPKSARRGVWAGELGMLLAVVGDGALMRELEIDAVRLPGAGLDWLARHGGQAAILRPDRYVFAVARDRAELAAAAAALRKMLR